jgi:NTE family protein
LNILGKIARSVEAFTDELKRPLHHYSQKQPGPMPRLGIALGGGFARGIAHIGILKVLEEEKIPVACVAGTSVGAIIAAAYCSGLSARELEEIAHQVRFASFARWTVSRYGFATNDRMTLWLERFLKVKTFEEMRVPLAIAATDFATGDPVVFRSGPLTGPIRASCAYPGMFLPVEVDGRLMVDGLLTNAVPAEPLRAMGADRVLSVYLRAHWVDTRGPRHLFEIIGQCFSIAQAKMSGQWRAHSDLVLEPNVNGFAYDDFERASDLIKIGEATARAALPQLKAWFQGATQTQAVATAAPVKSGARVPATAPALAK